MEWRILQIKHTLWFLIRVKSSLKIYKAQKTLLLSVLTKMRLLLVLIRAKEITRDLFSLMMNLYLPIMEYFPSILVNHRMDNRTFSCIMILVLKGEVSFASRIKIIARST